jgi:hypothetical protein
LRDIGERVRVTERAAHRIVAELASAGYITRERTGRRNRYTINAHFPLPDPVARDFQIGELLEILRDKQAHNGASRTSDAESDDAELGPHNAHPSSLASTTSGVQS